MSSMTFPMSFDGKAVIVTGGGSGIGRAIALELASLGAVVGLIGRDENKLISVAEEISKGGGRALSAAADIREPEQVKTAVGKLKTGCGAIDGLVNNAGGQYFSPLEKISPNGFDAVVRTNLHGTFHVMREVFEQSMKAHGGSVVNIIASMWLGMPMMAHSGAARAGVENLTKSAAFEWSRYGIRVNAVAPGYIQSSGLEKYDDEAKKWIPKLRNHVPMKRMGSEEEVSHVVTFLLSPAASYITGETIRVDGGASVVGQPWPVPELETGVGERL